MLVKMGYYNAHEIDWKTYHNKHISEGRDESDAEVLERVTGYRYSGIEVLGTNYQNHLVLVILMNRQGEFIPVVNRAHFLDTNYTFIFDIPEGVI